MPITIGSNIASLSAQRRLNDATAKQAKVFERLSSGMRINSASDDAAGLSIANSLNSDSRVYAQGIRNLNDGISLLNVADSSIESLSGILTRLQELAEQASNGIYGATQRKAIDAEAQALSKEFSRIASSTTFNNINLFKGGADNIGLQAGSGANSVISTGVGGAVGTGTYQNSISVGGLTTAGADSILTLDLNGDGALDLVTGSSSTNTVSISFNNGNGSFAAAHNYSSGTGYIADIAAGDFNKDGILDLVSLNGTTNSANILIGRGDGTFHPSVSYANGAASPQYVKTADINGDGNLDLVSVLTSGAFGFLLGNGDGTFSSFTSRAGLGGMEGLTTGDFNGDGYDDVAGINYTGSVIRLVFGTASGIGSAAAVTSIATGSIPFGIDSADLNGDGKLDLFTADAAGNSISVYYGNGDGTFAARVSFAPGTASPTIVKAGDINGDGSLDLFVGGSGSASVLLNNGNGTFSVNATMSMGLTSTVAIADLNGDGVSDLIYNSGNVNVQFQNTKDGISALSAFSLKTMVDARQAMPMLKKRQQLLAVQRSEIGSFQSRVGFATNVLQSTVENYRAAESRIRDADIAEESANLVRLSILQKAGSAILAQANQQPAIAMRLLKKE